jgi:hypothetical protein
MVWWSKNILNRGRFNKCIAYLLPSSPDCYGEIYRTVLWLSALLKTHVSLKHLQYITATGSLTYILGAFQVLRSVLFVQEDVDSDLRVSFKKGHLSGNRNGEGQHQQTVMKCHQSQTQPTTNIQPLRTKIKTDYFYRLIPYRAVNAPLPVIKNHVDVVQWKNRCLF